MVMIMNDTDIGELCPNTTELIPMKFENPPFYPGIQNTIRVGTKWFESISIGDMFKAQTLDETDIAIFEVVGLMRCRLDEIPNKMLELNHDGSCHSRAGLLKTLKGFYSDVSLKSEVTVIIFRYVETCVRSVQS